MSKTIKMDLSVSSIDQAIEELQKYRQELKFKISTFVTRMAEIGLQTIEASKYSHGDSDFNDLRSYIWLDEFATSSRATLVLAGKDVAFIEFGAGVHYNGNGLSSPHPRGQELGMLIGTYGHGYGLNDFWFYKKDGELKWTKSYGTEAAMPMYHAYEDIRDQFIAIAKEVFDA